jgi:hypothetical protein
LLKGINLAGRRAGTRSWSLPFVSAVALMALLWAAGPVQAHVTFGDGSQVMAMPDEKPEELKDVTIQVVGQEQLSDGTQEASKEMGLISPVVLDQGFVLGQEFGADGRPSAVLVDTDGKIASEVVVGVPAVLELGGVKNG